MSASDIVRVRILKEIYRRLGEIAGVGAVIPPVPVGARVEDIAKKIGQARGEQKIAIEVFIGNDEPTAESKDATEIAFWEFPVVLVAHLPIPEDLVASPAKLDEAAANFHAAVQATYMADSKGQWATDEGPTANARDTTCEGGGALYAEEVGDPCVESVFMVKYAHSRTNLEEAR